MKEDVKGRRSEQAPSGKAGGGGRAADEAFMAELAALYREADALYAGWSCPASTECCRFGVTGREPWVTSIEMAAVEQAVARRGGPLGPKRRALPLAGAGAGASAAAGASAGARSERTCPLLAHDGRCSVYADRPLGCRTFFCGRASAGADVPRRAIADITRRLRDLAARHRPGGDQGRPMGRVLGV